MRESTPGHGFMLMPPAPNRCQVCAVAHDAEQPHNRDSLYYQMRFYAEQGRWPTWHDAMAHCTEDVQAWWMQELATEGVET